MKVIIFFVLPLVFVCGCKKETIEISLCDSQNCNKYYEIWENAFKTRNSISDKYFTEHILVTKTAIVNWNEGESFNINYLVKIDWATMKNHDAFIVNINSQHYPLLSVSRGVYLTEKEIGQILDMRAFSSFISKVNPGVKLKFSSKKEALKAINSAVNSIKLKEKGLYYKRQKPIFEANGHPYLNASGELSRKENKCIFGEVDLITGKISIREDACWDN